MNPCFLPQGRGRRPAALCVALACVWGAAARGDNLAHLLNHPWPTNDDFADAIEIVGTNVVVFGHNVGATVEEGEPYHLGQPDDDDGSETVWWRWTAPHDGLLALSTEGSSFDTFLAVYTGSGLDDLIQIADGADVTYADTSHLAVPVAAGTTYHFVVAREFHDGTGQIRLALELDTGAEMPPPNDAFTNAIPLVGATANFAVALSGATLEPGEVAAAVEYDSMTNSVWWRWAAPADGVVTVLTVEGTEDIEWLLSAGASLTSLTLVASADSYDDLACEVTAGTEYRLAARDRTPFSPPMPAELRLFPGGASPSNDAFAAAETLAGTNSEFVGHFLGATFEAGESEHPGSYGQTQSVWYTWTPPSDGIASLRLLDGETGFAVYTGDSISNLASIAALGDVSELARGLVFPVLEDTIYRIAASGHPRGAFRARIAHEATALPPANDAFAAAIAITGTTYRAPAHNGGATQEYGEPGHYWSDSTNSVWWRWTAPSNGVATVMLSDNSMYACLAVYTGTQLSTLQSTEVGSDACGAFEHGLARVTFRALAGTTYRFAVAGDEGDEGTFKLHFDFRDDVVGTPANDHVQNAAQIAGNDAEVLAHNFGATKQTGEPQHTDSVSAASSVWWWWIAPGDGFLTLSTDGSTFDTGLAVYAGTIISAASRQSSDDYSGPGGCSLLTTRVAAGQVYPIVVDGDEGAQGFLRLGLHFSAGVPPAPGNDHFAAAYVVAGSDFETWGNTAGATRQAGEPLHGGDWGEWNDAHNSIWWRWTAPADGVLSLAAQGDDVAPVWAVYTGSSLAALSEMASEYDEDAGEEAAGSLWVTGGTQYHICIAGYDETAGPVRFGLAFNAASSPPANDAFADAIPLSGEHVETAGHNFGATMDPGEPAHSESWAGSSRSVWWTWAAPADGCLTVGSDAPQLAVYTGDDVTNLALVGMVPYNWLPPPTTVSFPVTSGTCYRIAAAGGGSDWWAGGTDAWFYLRLHFADAGPPPNDNFADAAVLTGIATNVWGSCYGATWEPGEPTFSDTSKTVWWAWTAPCDGRLVIDESRGSFWVFTQVFEGTSISELSEQRQDDIDWPDVYSVTVSAGRRYCIRAHDSDVGGAAHLDIRFVPDSPYACWAARAFPPGTPHEWTAPHGDPDFDGVPNAIELCLGRQPLVGEWDRIPALRDQGGVLSLVLSRDADMGSVPLIVEGSPALSSDSWQPIATYDPATGWRADLSGAFVIENGPGPIRQAEVFLPFGLDTTPRFFWRLRTDL